MIDNKLKFIFLHINKTGGISVASSLLNRDVSAIHRTARWYAENKPKEFKTYFKFTFVRNPWEKEVSDWFFHLSKGKKLSFEEYINMYFTEENQYYIPSNQLPPTSDINWYWHRHQLDWISLGGRTPAVNFIGRFENLQKDFYKVCKYLRLPKKRLGHYPRTEYTVRRDKNPRAYRSFYNSRTRKLVAEFYAKDIALFKYSF